MTFAQNNSAGIENSQMPLGEQYADGTRQLLGGYSGLASVRLLFNSKQRARSISTNFETSAR